MTTQLLGLRIENYKRIELVDIDFNPDGGVVAIMGDNEAGKTSLLDALATLIAGRKMPKAEQPIHKGADSAKIIGRFTDLTITRHFRSNGSTQIKLTSPDGVPVRNSDELLARLYSHIALDPLEFARLPEKEQVDTLLGLVGFDPAPLDAEYDRRFSQRTAEKRDRDSLRHRLEALPDKAFNAPDKPVSVTEIAAKLQSARAHNQAIDQHELAVEVARIRREKAKAELEAAQAEMDQHNAELVDLNPRVNLELWEHSLASADSVNEAYRVEQSRLELLDAVKAADTTVRGSDVRLAEIVAEKQEKLAAAPMPVDGLTIEDGRLILNGTAFADASTAVKIRTGVAIGIALNPDLRLITIRDASLLGDANRAAIDELAREHGFLIACEYVNTDEPVGVILEDGHVTEVRN